MGAGLRITRTPVGVAYRVTGGRVDLDALLQLLREAAAPPTPDPRALAGAREELDARRDARSETPGGLLRRRLGRALERSPNGDAGAGDARIELPALEDAWRRAHAPGRPTLVVAGDVEPVLLAGAAVPLPGPFGGEAAPGVAPAGEDARVQTLRHWRGVGLAASRSEEATALVSARILSRRLDRVLDERPRLEGSVELWRDTAGPALVVIGAAYSEERSFLARLAEALVSPPPSARAVADAAAELRAELLLAARTPEGLAEVVGREAALADEPGAAATLLHRLEPVDAEAVVRMLERLLEEGVTREVRP